MTITKAIASGPCTGATAKSTSSPTASRDEKNVKFGGPEVMKSVNNIWKISDKGGKETQVTHHTDGNLFFPVDLRRRPGHRLRGQLRHLEARHRDRQEHRNPHRHQGRPQGERRRAGQLTDAQNLRTCRLPTNAPPSSPTAKSSPSPPTAASRSASPKRRGRNRIPRWSPDGKWIAFVSDRTGREEIWLSDELGKTPKQLSDADCEKRAMMWSPDSKSLLWTGSDHKLRMVEIETGKTEVVAAERGRQRHRPQFSPDGKWISYARHDELLRTHVWVKELASGAGAHDRRRRFPAIERRPLDARRQEAAADRRPGLAGHCRFNRAVTPAL